jgi:hypothetical protein
MKTKLLTHQLNWTKFFVKACLFLIGFSINSAYSSQVEQMSSKTCMGLTKGILNHKYVKKNTQALVSKWLNEYPNIYNIATSRYTLEQSKMTRFELLKKHMTPHMRQLFLKAEPNFFKDGTIPSPLQVTKAMKDLYIQNEVPPELWILPGLALKDPVSGKTVYKTYDQLDIEWPRGFKVKKDFFGLKNGVIVMNWSGEIHDGFNVSVLIHDFAHLSSFLQTDYLKAFLKYNNYVLDRYEKTRNKELMKYLFGVHYGDSLFEEFWIVPDEKKEQLNNLLKLFNSKADGGKKPLSIESFSLYNREELKGELIPHSIKMKWDELTKDGKTLMNNLFKINIALKSNDSEMPEEFLLEKKRIIKGMNEIKVYFEPIISEVEHFYENGRIELGGALGDFFSQRAGNYSLNNDYFIELKRLHYGFNEEVLNRGYYSSESFELSMINLLSPLIQKAKLTPGQEVDFLIERAKNAI